jgi:hypothetical protein
MDGWNVRSQVELVAARCGLGVMSVSAREAASHDIKNEMKVGRAWSEDAYTKLHNDDFATRWSTYLIKGHAEFPEALDYPIKQPTDHAVNGLGCIGCWRKGKWTDACVRAAWGNAEPFGLAQAIKPCFICKEEMRYWCYGKTGDEQYRWSVDHRRPHKQGGCACHFNLLAIHSTCNSAKGAR